MTEEDYLSWTRPTAILKCLGARATQRQYQLFACACYRRVWRLLDEAERHAVEVAERCALHQDGPNELAEALAQTPALALRGVFIPGHIAPFHEADAAAAGARGRMGQSRIAEGLLYPIEESEKLPQARLLRCVVGNPYRPAPADPAWLAWNDRCVVRLADEIHATRDFTDMPIVGDALEEAGCTDAALLDHCRHATHHALGCWVLNLLRARLTLRLSFAEWPANWSGPITPFEVEIRNTSAETVRLAARSIPLATLTLLVMGQQGDVVACCGIPHWLVGPREPSFAPGEVVSAMLEHAFSQSPALPPGEYALWARLPLGDVELVSNWLTFTAPRCEG